MTIRELYAVEDEARGLAAEQRLALRKERSAVTIQEIKSTREQLKPLHSQGGVMADALDYLTHQWDSLVLFVDDGRIPIDNIACEQAIRPVALGRRNWLFTGSPRGGEAAAVLYSIVSSCKRSGVEPYQYLSDVLVRVCTHAARRIDELIPRRWREMRERSELLPLAR